MNKTLLLSCLSIICGLSLANANTEDSAYRHWPFDELIDSGAATPDASPHQAHARLSGPELCEGVIGIGFAKGISNSFQTEPENILITVAAKGEADLPRVLLLGDFISLGYEQPMRKHLVGRASVHHPPENCQSTVYGLKKIEQWLGDNPWDVIHFNWGIWDAHHLKDDRLRTTPEEYEQNLRKLVSRLKATGAKLMWASTTPLTGRVEQGGIWVEGSEIPRRNEIARKVMDESGILVDDLYQAVLPHMDRYHSADNCHFTPEGSAFLACRVAGTVESMLKADAGRGVSISNALDLGDWTVFPKGTSNTWQFEAGILKCSGKPASYIRTVKDYENYHLHH